MVEVSVCMITYNHEKYIDRAIQGVLEQNCEYKIELVISNDASTDATNKRILEAIRENSSKIKIRYINNSQNIGMMANFIQAIKECKGKYIALCEGDDYWTRSDKLSMQLREFERSNNFSAVVTNCDLINHNGGFYKKFGIEIDQEFKTQDLLTHRHFHTATLIFKKDDFPKNFPHNILSADRLLFLTLSLKGHIRYLGLSTAVYRKHELGLSSNVRSSQLILDLNMINFLKNKLSDKFLYHLENFILFTVLQYSKTIYFADFFTVLTRYIKQEVLKYIKILPSFNSHLTLKLIFQSTNKLNCHGLYNNR